MKLRVVAGSLVVAAVGAGCVHVSAPPPVTVTARVQISAPGPRLSTVPDIPAVAGAPVDAATIHATLDSYGSWIEDAAYGTIWIPEREAAGADFVPYGTQGQWVPTDSGWYWQSELAWGWLTFHYGRWVLVQQTWAWVPGALFAPAWVDWRVGEDWVGWAPLPPRGSAFTAPFAFCPREEFGATDVWSRVVYGDRGASLYATTVAIPPSPGLHGAHYSWGPVGGTGSGGGAVVVPVAQAWQTETAPRAGLPAPDTSGAPARARPVGAQSVAVAPVQLQESVRRAFEPPPPLPAPPEGREPSGEFAQRPLPSESARIGRVDSSGPALRETVSLGTTGPVLPPSRFDSSAFQPPSATAGPVRVAMPVPIPPPEVAAPSPPRFGTTPPAPLPRPSAAPTASSPAYVAPVARPSMPAARVSMPVPTPSASPAVVPSAPPPARAALPAFAPPTFRPSPPPPVAAAPIAPATVRANPVFRAPARVR